MFYNLINNDSNLYLKIDGNDFKSVPQSKCSGYKCLWTIEYNPIQNTNNQTELYLLPKTEIWERKTVSFDYLKGSQTVDRANVPLKNLPKNLPDISAGTTQWTVTKGIIA